MALPSAGNRSLPWIDVANDTGAIVAALLKAPGGTNVVGASEYLSMRDWLQLWASHIDVEARYRYIPLEEFCRDDPDGGKREIAEVLHFFEEFGYTGDNPDVVTPDKVCRWVFSSVPRYLLMRTYSSRARLAFRYRGLRFLTIFGSRIGRSCSNWALEFVSMRFVLHSCMSSTIFSVLDHWSELSCW